MSTAAKGTREKPEKRAPVLVDNLEVCRLLGVKPDTWRKRVAKGIAPLPFTAAGARTYYRAADVKHYLREGTWPARMMFRGRRAD